MEEFSEYLQTSTFDQIWNQHLTCIYFEREYMCAPNEVIDESLGMSTGFESSMAKLGDDESITDDGD